MREAIKRAAEWWSDPGSEAPETQWVRVPGVVENMNQRATGDPEIDWINHSASLLTSFAKPVRALSVGCGFGIIERRLRRHDFCQLIHGVDVAENAIETARKTAQAEGLDGLTYEVADLNGAKFPPETYDVVYAHASLHHIFQLEHLLNQIKQTLKPGGLFVVYEYIGPSQMQFPRRDLELADTFLKVIPERYRQFQKRSGIKKEAFRSSLDSMNSSDPSEGIRASEIVPLIASRFEIRHFRYVGGTLLLLVFNEIAGNFKENDAEIMPLVKALIVLDNFLIDNKVLPSYHVYMVCEKTDNPVPMQTRNVLPPAASILPAAELEWRSIPVTPTGSISANPNPFIVDSKGVGETTLSWVAFGTSKVEVRIDAPDGDLFAKTGPGRHFVPTGRWVRDGTTFYLQDASPGLPLTAENTLGMVRLTITLTPTGLISAEPNPFRADPQGVGETTVSWVAYGISKVEVRVNAPDGLLFAREGPGRHSRPTGRWIRDGVTFYLQNVSNGLPLVAENTIATVTLRSV
jgi:2-polyprenyl-3-methyl-5-hydroxy-6-metoxy-1,4-benzoquinol methylase